MKFKKIALFILILPLTLFLDLILYGLTKACPSCGSFWQWVQTEGALSFPIVVGITQWIQELLPKSSFNSVRGKPKLIK